MRKEFYRFEDATRYQRWLRKQGIESEICTAYNWREQATVHAVVPKER